MVFLGGGFVCIKWLNIWCVVMIVVNLICIVGVVMFVGFLNDNKVSKDVFGYEEVYDWLEVVGMIGGFLVLLFLGFWI